MRKFLFLSIIITGLLVDSPLVKADTTAEDRVYIFSSVWRNVRDNFAFPSHFKQVNPDSLFKCFLPKVMNAESENEFSLLFINPDGRSIIETGVIPDVDIEYTVDDLVSQKDSQLAKAIEILNL